MSAREKAAADSQAAREEEEIIRQLDRQPKVRLIIASGKGANEHAPVPVAVNGREYLIERDKEVLVPEAVANVLKLAVSEVCEIDDASRTTVFRKASRFSFQILGYGEAV